MEQRQARLSPPWVMFDSMNRIVPASGLSSLGFPAASPALGTFGLKFSSGGAHISRTMMLSELGAVLANVPQGSGAADYREAILQQNILGRCPPWTCRCGSER